MATVINVSIDARKRRDALDTRHLLAKAAAGIRSSVVKRISTCSTPPNSPLTIAGKGSSKPLRDTGQLMASITYRANSEMAVIGTSRKGARTVNDGAVIRPRKPSGWLWIPASRKYRRMLNQYGGSITALISHLRKNGSCYRKGNAFFVRYSSRREEMVFVLRKSVTVPARPFMYFSDDDRAFIRKTLGEIVNEKDT